MKIGTACSAFFCSHDEISKDCVMVMTSALVARRKQLQNFGKVLEKRFEVKLTDHIGFVVNDEKELKILNRTIKIDVLNEENEVDWCKRRRFATCQKE